MNKTAKIAALEQALENAKRVNSELSAMLLKKDEVIVTKNSELAKKDEKISSLEALLAASEITKGVSKTSKNSHLPPSVDLSRKNQSLREKSGKPVGGQIGHKGCTLRLSETPDVIQELVPEYCNDCGSSLLGKPKVLINRRQVIDIPPIVPITTEYQNYSIVCNCGHHQCSHFPEGVTNHVQYGPNIQSLVVYQSVYQYLPFKRLQGFFKEVMSVCLSKGTIENILRRNATKAEKTYETLRKVVELSLFVGSDETGAKCKKAKLWFWVWQNAIVTFIVAACSRSKQVIIDTFPNGLPNSIVCSDRLAAQLSTISKGSQLCLAHLLRDLNYLIETEKTPWATQFKSLLKDAIALKKIQTPTDRQTDKVNAIELRANQLLEKSFEQLGWTLENQHKTITFLAAMTKLRQALFPFLYHHEVPPDNNSSERAIRLIKVKTKISGQFKSLHQQFAILRSVIDTAIKNGSPVYAAVAAIVNIPFPFKKSAG
jgi:transposase